MLENIICFLFPSITESIYQQGYLDAARDTSQMVREYPLGDDIMDAIIDSLPKD